MGGAAIIFIAECEVDNCGSYGINVQQSTSVVIGDCTITNNGVIVGVFIYYSYVYIDQYSTLLMNSVIENNASDGVCVYDSDNVYINKCIIRENTSRGIYIVENYGSTDANNLICTNNLICNNSADGIICLGLSSSVVLNNTVVENAGYAGLAYDSFVSSLEIHNNIFAYNNNGQGCCGIYGSTTGDTINISYNNSYGHTNSDYYECGTEADNDGNLSVDPLFVSADSPLNPIYRLSYGSPCIDAADNDSYSMGSNDLDNSQRFVNGTIDMGAYEYYDSDNDGLPNQWEIDNNLDPNVSDADADSDDDGQSNMSEYLSGSDPQVWNADFPEVRDILMSELGGEMPLSFILTDVQSDICSIDVQYKQEGGVYTDADCHRRCYRHYFKQRSSTEI